MESVEIISHLTKKDWKRSWQSKVVEDNKKNLRDYHTKNCYFGHFTSDDDFILYYHKEFEGNSLNSYFHGKVEMTPEGCRVLGHFAKKKTANIFLVFAVILTALVTLVMIIKGQYQLMVAPAAMCAICLLCYNVTPKSTKEKLLERLKEISFADMPNSRKASAKAADMAAGDDDELPKPMVKGGKKAAKKEVKNPSLRSVTQIKTADIEKKPEIGKKSEIGKKPEEAEHDDN